MTEIMWMLRYVRTARRKVKKHDSYGEWSGVDFWHLIVHFICSWNFVFLICISTHLLYVWHHISAAEHTNTTVLCLTFILFYCFIVLYSGSEGKFPIDQCEQGHMWLADIQVYNQPSMFHWSCREMLGSTSISAVPASQQDHHLSGTGISAGLASQQYNISAVPASQQHQKLWCTIAAHITITRPCHKFN